MEVVATNNDFLLVLGDDRGTVRMVTIVTVRFVSMFSSSSLVSNLESSRDTARDITIVDRRGFTND